MPSNYSDLHTPMYFRIQMDIIEKIKQGLLKPGQQLPTEAELAQEYQVSRITAKRALDELVHQGRAFRQQGRGTFVAQSRIRDITGFGSFSEDMRSRGRTPGAKLLEFKELDPATEIRMQLQLEEGEHAYFLKRLRYSDNEPVAVESCYLPCKLYPGLLDEDLNNTSLYKLMSEKFKIVPTWADAEIEATRATKEEASYLNLEPGAPVLTAHRVTFSPNYDVIEVTTSVYRGDRFTFYSGRQFIR